MLVRRTSRAACIAFLALCFAGCELLGILGDDRELREVDDIEFSLAEYRGGESSEPRLYFSMQTEKEYPCLGYSIEYRVRRSGDAVVVDVLGVSGPGDICATMIAPASAKFELRLGPGTYSLTIKTGDSRDTYALQVADDRVEISELDADWTHPTSTLQWRYPSNSFAFYCGTLIETKHLCTDFESELDDLPLTPVDVPDEGKWPYRLSSTGHYYDAPAKYYTYPDEETWETVKEAFRMFTRQEVHGREGVGLVVENWLGDGEHSWMVEPE